MYNLTDYRLSLLKDYPYKDIRWFPQAYFYADTINSPLYENKRRYLSLASEDVDIFEEEEHIDSDDMEMFINYVVDL